jgi:hypothetical protein
MSDWLAFMSHAGTLQKWTWPAPLVELELMIPDMSKIILMNAGIPY